MKNSKNVLVTGASRGIGLLAVKELARRGHWVFAGMRNLAGANATIAQELAQWATDEGYDVVPVELDVTDDTSVATAVQQVADHGPIGALVNNAGVMPVGVTEAYSIPAIEQVMDVNLSGVIRCCRAALPHMRTAGSGHIVNLSSIAGRFGMPFFGIYCASKWALEGYSESLAYEVDAFGISVSIVEPGGHATDLIRTPPAADDSRVLSGYGELADAPQKMISMFEDMFAQEEAINDPNNVAVAISDAIECNGKPPLRIEVGAHMGVSEINRKTAAPQNDLIAALGFAPLAKGKSAGFIAVVDFPVRPEHLDACEAALLGIVPDTLAEPGCVLFAPVRSEDPSASLKLIEAFGSEGAVSHHMQQSYTKAFLEKANGWLDGPIKVNVLQGSEVVMRQFT